MKQLNLDEYEQFIFDNKIPDGYKKLRWWLTPMHKLTTSAKTGSLEIAGDRSTQVTSF